MSTHPEIMYAERSSADEPEKNIIYFTINAPDIQGEPKLDITPTSISFSAKAGDSSKGVPEKQFEFQLDFYDEVIPEETKKVVTTRAVVLVLRKKNAQSEYWPRLTKEKQKNRNWIKTDFSKWVDEDEQDGEAADIPGMDDMAGMGGMGGGMPGMEGMGGMGGMGGMPGMGGMGGMGGAGGMDFAKLMEQMGGMGGMGGAGGPGGMPDFGAMSGGADDDEDDVEEISTEGAKKVADEDLEDVE